MLFLLISWILLYGACAQISPWLGTSRFGVFGNLISGLAILLLVLQVLGFFVPLRFAGMGIVILGIYYWFRIEKAPIIDSLKQWTTPAFGALCLLPAVIPSWINDDISYYLPSIKWFAEEGWKEGLTHLNVRFGLSSSWHALSAAFYWENITPARIGNFNGLLLFLFFKELYQSSIKRPFVLWGAILFAIPFCNSPSPDLPVALLGAYLLIHISQFQFKDWMYWLVLLIGLKATALPLIVLFPLAFYSLSKRNFYYLGLGLIAAVVWVAKNSLLSGHPFFPYSFDFLALEHAYPNELLRAFREGVLAEIYGVGFNMEEWQKANLSWAGRLLQLAQLKPYKVILNLLVLFSSFWIIRNFVQKKHYPIALLLAIGTLVWLMLAPNYRFFLAPVLACGAFVSIPFFENEKFKNWLLLFPMVIAFYMTIRQPEGLRLVSCATPEPLSMEQWIVPTPYPKIEGDMELLNGSVQVYRPSDCIFCGDSPKPCYPDTVRSYNQSFGYDLMQDGEKLILRKVHLPIED